MVQKIHPWGVIWGPYFPPPVFFFSKKNQLSVLSIYIVVLELCMSYMAQTSVEMLGPDLSYILRVSLPCVHFEEDHYEKG